MLAPGQTIDRYTVDAILGQGGMAVVYRVTHNQLGSYHALKVLTLQSPGLTERLLQEGRVQASLRHPNVVAVTDVIEVGGHPGLVMEYVEGPSLDGWLGDNRPEIREAERLFRAVVAGVAAAHDKGLVHRDLKPGNVMLAPTSGVFVPKVTDFGLAKALADESEGLSKTRSGVTMGTPAYMAPEQIRDAKNVDSRADVFSLGCILYELVTGRAPFAGPDMLSIFNAVASGSYPPPVSLNPDLPARLQNAIQACLVVDRDRRVASCAGILEILDGQIGSIPPAPQPGATLHPANTWAGSVADLQVAVEPAKVSQPSATPRPKSDPPLDASLAPVTQSIAPTPPKRRTWLVAGLALGVVVLAGGGAAGVLGGSVLLRHNWQQRAGQTLSERTEGEVTIGTVDARVREVVLSDIVVAGTDGSPFATIDEVVVSGRWRWGLRPRFVPETAAITGMKLELRDRPRGWALPEKTIELLRAADGPTAGVALREVTTDASEVALVVRGERLVTTWSSAHLGEVGSGDDWTAGTFTVTDLRVGASDPLLTATEVSVGPDGAMTATGLDLWIRLRADGLLDVPTPLADRVPDWLGGARSGEPDTSWTDLAHTLLPTVPASLSATSGTLHVLDRAHAVKAVEWTFALDRLAVGPERDGWTPVELSAGFDGARLTGEGDLRSDGLVRGRVNVRMLPLEKLAPYLDPSLKHYQVRPVAGTVSLGLELTAKGDSVAADLDARAEGVRFARAETRPDGPRPPRYADKLLTERASVSATSSTAGSLGDWEWRGFDELLTPFSDALFAPAGKALVVAPPARPPDPEPDVVSVPVPTASPRPTPPAVGPKPEPPAPAEPQPRPRDRFGKEVRDALEEMKDRMPGKRGSE